MKGFFLCILFAGLHVLDTGAQAPIQWPEVRQTHRPWARWWWMGSAVDSGNLAATLKQYQQAGIGGLEITPIYGVKGTENRFIPFLSDPWMKQLTFTLKTAEKLQMGVDMANGTGWPFGGPFVSDADASKTIYHKSFTILPHEEFPAVSNMIRKGWVKSASNRPLLVDTIQLPFRSNPYMQQMAIDQIHLEGALPLICAMAYSNRGELRDVTQLVKQGAQKDWVKSADQWTVYLLYQGLHGKMVERAAPGGEGYAIDHFSANALHAYLRRFDTAFMNHDISTLRAFFNDSYEVDDAKGQANWTDQMFQTFQLKKGYDLRRYLPALFGQDQAEMNRRVLYDYRTVIDELILTQFTQTWKAWGEKKGKLIRNQSHGSPANTLDLYGAIDIPETEGNDILRFKFASSAAHVMGKKWVSAEAATWLSEHFLSSWNDVKRALDLYFLGGVNHIFYHGITYSPTQAPWPGWLFYAAVQFQPTNPQWVHFPALNQYATRIQSFLQEGKPVPGILLYYPITDRYMTPGSALLQHFDGMEKNFEHTVFESTSKALLEKGYSFDFFSDRQLQNFRAQSNQIATEGGNYQTIVLPANQFMEWSSFQKLMQLVHQGVTVLALKELPSLVPGHTLSSKSQDSLNRFLAAISWQADGAVKKAKWGKGHIWVCDSLAPLLKLAGIAPQAYSDRGIGVVSRTQNGQLISLVVNQTNQAMDQWLPLPAQMQTAALFDPLTGQMGLGSVKMIQGKGLHLRVQLNAGQSMIIQSSAGSQSGRAFKYLDVQGSPIIHQGPWELTFLEGGPRLPNKKELTQLVSWTETGDSLAAYFSGTARYRTTMVLPKSAAKNDWLLKLDELHATAEVRWNGKSISTIIAFPFQCRIPAHMIKEVNQLELIVANQMANRIIHMEQQDMPWKIFYNINFSAKERANLQQGVFSAKNWKPIAAGLKGPVSITPLK
jgi:hypothetical protein